MTEKEFKSKELSYWQLAGETKIEIPIIQRDYAQGRDSERKIRTNFLDALRLATRDQNRLELDFVYGKIDDGTLQPLDGQQRLTTLFLLHWYIACKEQKFSQYQERFSRFSYETRTSSRSFCKQLALHGLDFQKLLTSDKGLNNRISKTIIDASWYFLAWRRDPTIKAMLHMLDAIDEKFSDEELIWEKLAYENRITFQYIELKNFGLSDDLYIKMNARGKALTPFENFKAKFEQHISIKEWESEADSMKFSGNIDNSWTDLFWAHRDAEMKIDSAFIKYFAGIAINLYAQNLIIDEDPATLEVTFIELQKKSSNKISNEAVKRELIEKRIEKLYNSPSDLEPKDLIQESDLDYLKGSLNFYADKQFRYDNINAFNINLWDYCSESTLFKELIKTTALTTYKQRVLFYAQTSYLMKCESIPEFFADWMRVVRNIVQHATIDSAGTFIGAIGLIKEISDGAANIYGFLAGKKLISNFASTQVSEELQKAHIIKNNPQHKELIHAVEDTDFCQGRIGFALYCVDFNNDTFWFDADKLKKVKVLIQEHFSGTDITNDFRRALFTIDDNSFYNYWGTWSYNTETVKRCMIEDIWDLKDFAYNNGFKHYLKSLINKLINKNLLEIAAEFEPIDDTPNWKTKLIKDPKLLDKYNQSRYFGITNDNKTCYLFLNKKRPGSRDDCHKVR